MGIFFRKSVKIAPGVRLNFGKRGTSVSIGPRGAKVNFSKKGTYLNTSIPGTGIYMREKISGSKANQRYVSNKQSDIEAINKNPLRFSIIFICLLLAVAVPVVGGGSWWFFPGFFIGGIILGCLIPSKKEDSLENNIPPSTLINKPLDILKEEVANKLEEPINPPSNIDPLFKLAARLVVAEQKGSTSLIQRKFEIGYNRAGYLMDQLEAVGVVGSTEGNRARLVLIKTEYDLEMLLSSINYNEDIVLRKSYIENEAHDKLNMPSIDQPLEKEHFSVGHADVSRLDPLFEETARLIVIQQQGSTSLIQRKFAIGYNRAGRLMDQLEATGIVSPFEGSKAREVLIKNEHDLENILNRIDIVECENKENEFDSSAVDQAIIDTENSSRLIHIGQSLEKEGMIDEAIAVYEKSILSKLPATIPYDRLMVLYRKKKDYVNEIRIIKDAISVFMAENERRAGRVIEGDSSLYNEVMQALETNESIRYDDGKWAFVQYNVMDYITRLEKAKKLNEKSKKQTKSEINE